MIVSAVPVAASAGQSDSGDSLHVAYHLKIEGVAEEWPLVDSVSTGTVRETADMLVAWYREEGYYFADVDSVVYVSDGTRGYTHTEFHVTRGPLVVIGVIELNGVEALPAARLLETMDTRVGGVLSEEVLETDLAFLLREYERAGYPLARVQVDDIRISDMEDPQLEVVLSIEEGYLLLFSRIELDGAERTSPDFAARILGYRVGRPVVPYDPEQIRRRLLATGVFEDVGDPDLALTPDGEAIIRIPVEEESPGSFDFVLGYVPSAGSGNTGSMMGNGHLVVRNLFGHGRRVGLQLNRIPGQVSTIEVNAAEPFAFGRPARLEAAFKGHQQDSTYGNQRIRLEAGYRLADGLETFVTMSREFTLPGVAGLLGTAGRSPIPRADSWFAGVGVGFRNLDRIVNPSRGLILLTNFEQGTKSRTYPAGTGGAGELESGVYHQQRMMFEGRLFIPTVSRQVIAVGADLSVVLANVYDESDLFRMGGANTLRGYQEERFQGRIVSRGLLEYRFLLDRQSYAFVFSDLGYIERPRMGSIEPVRQVRPGYGIGLQYSTNLGLVSVSYALNPEEGPADGNVHIGLSFEL